MKATVGGSGGNFELAPEGMHLARCIKVIDLGTQEQKWKDQVKHNRQVLVMFELPKVMIDVDGEQRPQSISKKYTLSFNAKANFRKDMETWFGRFSDKQIAESKGFDPSKLVGRPAAINIAHSDDKKYANIKSITGVMEGLTVPDQINPSVLFDLDDFDYDVWDTLSEKMKDWIGKSPECEKALAGSKPTASTAPVADDFDDIPF